MVSVTATGIRITLRVQPRAARDRVVGPHGEALKVQVSAPPVDGAANEAVEALLSKWLDVPRRMVRVAHGLSGRDKVVEIASDAPESLAERLRTRLEGCVDKAGGRN